MVIGVRSPLRSRPDATRRSILPSIQGVRKRHFLSFLRNSLSENDEKCSVIASEAKQSSCILRN